MSEKNVVKLRTCKVCERKLDLDAEGLKAHAATCQRAKEAK